MTSGLAHRTPLCCGDFRRILRRNEFFFGSRWDAWMLACLPLNNTKFILTLSNMYWMWHNNHSCRGTAGRELNIQWMGFQDWEEFVSCCYPLLQPLRSHDTGNPSCSAWCRGAPGQSDNWKSFRRSGDADTNLISGSQDRLLRSHQFQ